MAIIGGLRHRRRPWKTTVLPFCAGCRAKIQKCSLPPHTVSFYRYNMSLQLGQGLDGDVGSCHRHEELDHPQNLRRKAKKGDFVRPASFFFSFSSSSCTDLAGNFSASAMHLRPRYVLRVGQGRRARGVEADGASDFILGSRRGAPGWSPRCYFSASFLSSFSRLFVLAGLHTGDVVRCCE